MAPAIRSTGARPASVSATERVVGSDNTTPCSSSKARTARDRVGWLEALIEPTTKDEG